MHGRGIKIENAYVDALGERYELTPKAVFAAIAVSLAIRLQEDNIEAGLQLVANEWATLHRNGIIPQKPR